MFSWALSLYRNNPWNELPLEINVFFQTPYFLLGSDPGYVTSLHVVTKDVLEILPFCMRIGVNSKSKHAEEQWRADVFLILLQFTLCLSFRQSHFNGTGASYCPPMPAVLLLGGVSEELRSLEVWGAQGPSTGCSGSTSIGARGLFARGTVEACPRWMRVHPWKVLSVVSARFWSVWAGGRELFLTGRSSL